MGLLVKGRQRPLPQQVELILVEASLQTKKQTVVALARRIYCLLIDQDGVDDPAHLDQLLPIVAVARKARHFPRRDRTDFAQADLGDHPIEARPLEGFVLDALKQAVHDHRPGKGTGLVRHSDRGSQYLSIKYTERLAEAGIEPPVVSLGDSYDNALAETINGLFKAEVIHRRGPWRSFEADEYTTLEWVNWFNSRRLLETIGNIQPAEAETNIYAALETEGMAA